MRAIILAAGRGSRMKNLTSDRPKCLVELNGKSLLEYQLEALRGAGIREIAVVTGYRREMLVQPGLVEFHNPRWAETNMVSSLESAEAWLNSEACLISYSDIFYSAEGPRRLMACDDALAVAYDPDWLTLWTKRFGDPLLDAETFRIRDDGTLTEIGGRPSSVDEIQGQYMGVLRFTPDGWREIKRIRASLSPADRDRMHMTGTLQKVIEAARLSIRAVPYFGVWGEVDSGEDLAAYQTPSSSGRSGT